MTFISALLADALTHSRTIARYIGYTALEDSQEGLHEGKDDATTFIKYLLSTIIAAYRDLDDRISIVSSTSLDTVKNAIDNKLGKFTKKKY